MQGRRQGGARRRAVRGDPRNQSLGAGSSQLHWFQAQVETIHGDLGPFSWRKGRRKAGFNAAPWRSPQGHACCECFKVPSCIVFGQELPLSL